jgi:hypothetical protein
MGAAVFDPEVRIAPWLPTETAAEPLEGQGSTELPGTRTARRPLGATACVGTDLRN